jgi:hypothetical protein
MINPVNFVSPLNAPNSIVLSPQNLTINFSNSVSGRKLSFSNNVMLFPESQSTRTSVRWIKGTEVNDILEQSTEFPPMSHLHSSGHSIVTLAGTINNHNQKNTADVANSSDTSTKGSLDGMAI